MRLTSTVLLVFLSVITEHVLGQTPGSCGGKTYFRIYEHASDPELTIGVQQISAAAGGSADFAYAMTMNGATSSAYAGASFSSYVQNAALTQSRCTSSPDTACFSDVVGSSECNYDAAYVGYTCCCKAGFEPNTTKANCLYDGTASNENTDCIANDDASADYYEIACIDTDECTTGLTKCAGGGEVAPGTCQNELGYYTCNCFTSSYVWDVVTETCIDVDECNATTDLCGTTNECTNFPGYHECNCTDTDYVITTDKKQCLYDLCIDNPCSSHGNCTFHPDTNSTTCSCDTFYSRTVASPIDDCIDTDECSSNPCHSTAICTNLMPSHSCTCNSTDFYVPKGAASSGLDNTFECDLDNCQADPGADGCGTNAQCDNNLNSNSVENCKCDGSHPYGDPDDECYVDPCLSFTCNASVNEVCVAQNTTGIPYAECECEPGFVARNSTPPLNCEYINPCLTNNGGCDVTSTTCNDLGNGNRTCDCKAGYVYANDVMCDENEIHTNSTFNMVLPYAIDSSANLESNLKSCFSSMASVTNLQFTGFTVRDQMVAGIWRTVVEITSISANKFLGDAAELRNDIMDFQYDPSSNCYAADFIRAGFNLCSDGTGELMCDECEFSLGRSTCCSDVSGTTSTSKARFYVQPNNLPASCGNTCDLTDSTCNAFITAEFNDIKQLLKDDRVCTTDAQSTTNSACTADGILITVDTYERPGDMWNTLKQNYTLTDYNECDDDLNIVTEPECPQNCANLVAHYECNCISGIPEVNGVCEDAVMVSCSINSLTVTIHAGMAAVYEIQNQPFMINGDSSCEIMKDSSNVYAITVQNGNCGISIAVQSDGSLSSGAISVSNFNSSSVLNTAPVSFETTCVSPSQVVNNFQLNSNNVAIPQTPNVISIGDQQIQGTIVIEVTQSNYIDDLQNDHVYSPGDFVYFKALFQGDTGNSAYNQINIVITELEASTDQAFASDIIPILKDCAYRPGFGGGNSEYFSNGKSRNVRGKFKIPTISSGSQLYLRFKTKTCIGECSEACDTYTTSASRRKRSLFHNRLRRETLESEEEIKELVILISQENNKLIATQSTYMFAIIAVLAIILVAVLAVGVFWACRKKNNSQTYTVNPDHVNMYTIENKKASA